MNPTLATLLESVRIPSDFARYENIIEHNDIARLNEWKRNVHHTLVEIRSLLETLDASSETLSLQEQASVISAVAAFDSTGPWIISESQGISRGMSTLVQSS